MNKKGNFIALILIICISTYNLNAQSEYASLESINKLIEKKRTYNKSNARGFIIQLYNGSEATARSVLNRFKAKYGWVRTKLIYDTPDWKTQVGSYRTRLDADKALNKFKEDFSGGIIINSN